MQACWSNQFRKVMSLLEPIGEAERADILLNKGCLLYFTHEVQYFQGLWELLPFNKQFIFNYLSHNELKINIFKNIELIRFLIQFHSINHINLTSIEITQKLFSLCRNDSVINDLILIIPLHLSCELKASLLGYVIYSPSL